MTTVRRVDAGETETHRKSQRRMCDQIVMELGDIMRIRAQKAFVLAWNPGLPIRSCLAPWMQPATRPAGCHLMCDVPPHPRRVVARQTRASRFSESVLARQMGVSHAAITAQRRARVAGKDRLGLIEQPLAGAQDDRCNHKVHLVD